MRVEGPINTEADLCRLFIGAFNATPGWTCYPEAAGFDVLVVHEDGRQIGVEAKLQLNAKVADQILPHSWDDFYGKPGPDHRLVIVSRITDAGEGIGRMLDMLGVTVLCPYGKFGESRHFSIGSQLLCYDQAEKAMSIPRMFDWSPSERCQVPVMVPNLPAGVPAPVKLTPWKESALKAIALMRAQGFITAKQIAAFGMGTTAWTQPGSLTKPAWLKKGTVRGTWLETEHMPPFDQQHPEVYALVASGYSDEAQPQLELSP